IYCSGCHNVDGTQKTGPALNGKFDTTEEFDDGSTGLVDENYIRESILNPNAKIVKGFRRPSEMQSFQG
ncbi:MAG: cytochrome c oxidase subunit II, partial [Burkholderiales bacterium]|nr:cytochrome c oxidase subunit II [Burkholderiales bacterium]